LTQKIIQAWTLSKTGNTKVNGSTKKGTEMAFEGGKTEKYTMANGEEIQCKAVENSNFQTELSMIENLNQEICEEKENKIFTDGSYYEGYLRNEKMAGEGKLSLNNGTTLTGTWKNDIPSGQMRKDGKNYTISGNFNSFNNVNGSL